MQANSLQSGDRTALCRIQPGLSLLTNVLQCRWQGCCLRADRMNHDASTCFCRSEISWISALQLFGCIDLADRRLICRVDCCCCDVLEQMLKRACVSQRGSVKQARVVEAGKRLPEIAARCNRIRAGCTVLLVVQGAKATHAAQPHELQQLNGNAKYSWLVQ